MVATPASPCGVSGQGADRGIAPRARPLSSRGSNAQPAARAPIITSARASLVGAIAAEPAQRLPRPSKLDGEQSEVIGQRRLADENMFLRQVGSDTAPNRSEGLDRVGQGVGPSELPSGTADTSYRQFRVARSHAAAIRCGLEMPIFASRSGSEITGDRRHFRTGARLWSGSGDHWQDRTGGRYELHHSRIPEACRRG